MDPSESRHDSDDKNRSTALEHQKRKSGAPWSAVGVDSGGMMCGGPFVLHEPVA